MPTQQRSRERVEHILSVAEAMIVESGVGSLKTNEIAARAGVPVGSLYQYFTGVEGLVGALVDRYHLYFESEVGTLFDTVHSPEEFLAAIRMSQVITWEFLLNNRGYRELWCGAQTWAPLRQRDWADTLKNADTINHALSRLLPNLPAARLRAFCIMVCDASGSVARMAIEFPDLQEALRGEWYAMIVAGFLELSRQNILHDA
jgi:AcrR family transcriptional regulator